MNELEYLKKYIHPEDNLEEAIKRLELITTLKTVLQIIVLDIQLIH